MTSLLSTMVESDLGAWPSAETYIREVSVSIDHAILEAPMTRTLLSDFSLFSSLSASFKFSQEIPKTSVRK